MSGFSKNWNYVKGEDDITRPEVKGEYGHPHYREQADISLIEVAEDDRDYYKRRKFNVVAGSVSTFASTKYEELSDLEAIADINHFQQKYPDLVIFRVNANGEGRILGGEKVGTESARFPDHRKESCEE